MRHLRCSVVALTAGLAVALGTASVATAHRPHERDGVVTPVHKVAGFEGGELLGEAWVQLLSHPVDTFAGSCMPLGRRGAIQSPAPGPDGTAACTVKKGTTLFFWFGSECSDVEEPPFFGADEAEQRACAIASDEFFVASTISVDGGDPIEVLNRRFELVSPQRTVELPEDNFLGVPAQTATFVAHGWGVLVRGLRPGSHTIVSTLTDVEGLTVTFTASIEVVRGGGRRHHHDDDD